MEFSAIFCYALHTYALADLQRRLRLCSNYKSINKFYLHFKLKLLLLIILGNYFPRTNRNK